MAGFRFVAVALLAALPGFSQLPAENDRLMSLARLWTTVEYFHPYLQDRDIDWDGTLVAAIPKIRAAASRADYQAAVAGMLDELHDPDTYLIAAELKLPASEPSARTIQIRTVRTATTTAFLLGSSPSAVDHIFVELAGINAVVRLSEPFTSEPKPHVAKPDPRYADPFPNTELRLLAAIKVWGAIHYFFAYKDLMDEDWDDVFPTYFSKLIDAKDAVDYNLVMADLLTHLTDTNAAPHSKTLDTYFGEVPVGLRIRLLDKYPIVTDVLDPVAVQAGIKPGFVLKRIGGESVTDRFRRFVQYVPASSPQRSGFDTIQKVTNGPEGSEVELMIENAQGEAHPIRLSRASRPPAPQRSTEPVAILPGNIGYLDLDRLEPEAAASALIRLQNTKAIIFDLRSSQAPAATDVAAYLVSQTNVAAALVTTPLALHPDVPSPGVATQTTSTFVVQTLPIPRQPLYKGKTIALIDERTIGEAESAGLMFEAANKTEFVGVPSAGADSSLAEISVPGGITITYSTQDIRHGNGGKLQRLGIQPNLTAPTTAKGLLAGKDEPLEAAIAHLSH